MNSIQDRTQNLPFANVMQLEVEIRKTPHSFERLFSFSRPCSLRTPRLHFHSFKSLKPFQFTDGVGVFHRIFLNYFKLEAVKEFVRKDDYYF